MKKEISVVLAEPDKTPIVTDISHDIRSMQKIVGGYLETIRLDRETVLVCNEEGKLIGLDYNRIVDGMFILGTFFICGFENGVLTSLDKQRQDLYMHKLQNSKEKLAEQTPIYNLILRRIV